MKTWIRVCFGEVKKQKQNYYNTMELYLSMLLWPMLTGISSYFVYFSFDLSFLTHIGIATKNDLLIFVFTGALGYNCFFAMVQSALFLRNERENGTLEIVFLTSANRLAIVYGRALGGITQNVGMFSVFIVILLLFTSNFDLKLLIAIPFSFVIILISSVVWGGLINAIFIVSRDVDFWFIICDQPMMVFSGTELPINIMPVLFKIIGSIFPLTYCLKLVRQIFNDGNISWTNVLQNVIILITLCVITKIILIIAENRNRKTGDLQLY